MTAHFLDGLTRRLTDRGMTIINLNATGFEIEDVPKELVEQWSRHRRTIVSKAQNAPIPALTPKAQRE